MHVGVRGRARECVHMYIYMRVSGEKELEGKGCACVRTVLAFFEYKCTSAHAESPCILPNLNPEQKLACSQCSSHADKDTTGENKTSLLSRCAR